MLFHRGNWFVLCQENGPDLKSPNVGKRRGLKSQIAISACCPHRRMCAYKSLPRPWMSYSYRLNVISVGPPATSHIKNTHNDVDYAEPNWAELYRKKPRRRAPGLRGESGATVAASHPAALPLPISTSAAATQTTAPAPARKICRSLVCVVAVVTSWRAQHPFSRENCRGGNAEGLILDPDPNPALLSALPAPPLSTFV